MGEIRDAVVCVLDVYDVPAVDPKVVSTLVVALAVLGDGEVEPDRLRPRLVQTCEVLLRDRQSRVVGAFRQLGRQQQRVVAGEQTSGAGEGVEVVRLYRLEPAVRATRHPDRDNLGQAKPLRGDGRVEQHLARPTRVMDKLSGAGSEQQARVMVPPPGQRAGLGLEGVEVAERVRPSDRRRVPVPGHSGNPGRGG